MVFRQAAAALAIGLVVTACGDSAPKPPLPAAALDGVLIGAGEINEVTGTSAMTPNDPFTAMSDHRNLLPNINCLGIWQVGEKEVKSRLTA